MITDRTLARLRIAASLALLTPGLSVAVEVEGVPVVEAGRGPFLEPAPDEASRARIPVCAFHRCVGKAHGLRRQGSQVEMVGVPGDLEPDIVLSGTLEVSILPGGIVRRTADDSWIHLSALSLPAEAVGTVARGIAERTGVRFTLHADRVLDVTVCVTDTPRWDRAAAHEVIDALEQIAAVATVESLASLLEAEPDWDAAAVALAD